MKIRIWGLLACCMFLLCGCIPKGSLGEGGVIISKSGRIYEVETKNREDQLCREGLDLFSASASTLKNASQLKRDTFAEIPKDAMEAARLGASMLERFYGDWAVNAKVCVSFSQASNAWIVWAEETEDGREEIAGAAAVGCRSGEVLYLGCGGKGL